MRGDLPEIVTEVQRDFYLTRQDNGRSRSSTLSTLTLHTGLSPDLPLNLTTEILLIGLKIIPKNRNNLFQRLGWRFRGRERTRACFRPHTTLRRKETFPQPMETSICRTTAPMIKLASQFVAVAIPTPLARRELGNTSAGRTRARGPYKSA